MFHYSWGWSSASIIPWRSARWRWQKWIRSLVPLCYLICLITFLNCIVADYILACWKQFSKEVKSLSCVGYICIKLYSKISFSGDSYHMEVSRLVFYADLLTGFCVVLVFATNKLWSKTLLSFSFVIFCSLVVFSIAKSPFWLPTHFCHLVPILYIIIHSKD